MGGGLRVTASSGAAGRALDRGRSLALEPCAWSDRVRFLVPTEPVAALAYALVVDPPLPATLATAAALRAAGALADPRTPSWRGNSAHARTRARASL